jgi:hypothetical protein
MDQLPPKAVLVPSVLVGAALMLGACSSMTTYGTGTTAAAQTFQDVTGIVSLGGKKKGEKQIDYEPRPPIVEPPETTLPPPGSDSSAEVAANWPVDPDEERKRMDAVIKEKQAAGESLKFTVPEEESVSSNPNARSPGEDWKMSPEKILRQKMRGTGPNAEDQKKLFADAKHGKVGSFDENGNPVRRYLTEPPAEYREPDAESSVEIAEKPNKKKGFKWPDLWPF